jgi:hypothetical protein
MCSINDSQRNGHVPAVPEAVFDAADFRSLKFRAEQESRGFTGKKR